MEISYPTPQQLGTEGFHVSKGSVLCSTYWVQDFLGEGSFGKVALCVKWFTKTAVAVKITKNHPIQISQAETEIAMLRRLEALDPDECNIVRWSGSFLHSGHICLEFELLAMSLRDFLQHRGYLSLPLNTIRPILRQLATALSHLKQIGIIHADLKPENIMIVDNQEPLRVKIIDFGLACHVSEVIRGSVVQTLWYRSPEVLLGLPFTEAIDLWSVGCVAVELFTGWPLYPANSEYDMIRYIGQTQGQLPDHLITPGLYSSQFFSRDTEGSEHLWRLKTPIQYEAETGIQSIETRLRRFSCLDELEQTTDSMASEEERHRFVELVKMMLQLDADQRLTPSEMLQHPFVFMEPSLTQQAKTSNRSSDNQSPECTAECPTAVEMAAPQQKYVPSSKLEDNAAADILPAVAAKKQKKKKKGRIRSFCRRMLKCLCCCFSSEEEDD